MTASFCYRFAQVSSTLLQGLLVLFYLAALPAYAEDLPGTATTQPSSEGSVPDSVRLVQSASLSQTPAGRDSLNSVPVTAVPAKKNDAPATPSVPEGFISQKLRKSESLSKYCGKDSLCQVIYMKVNRIDRQYIPAGRSVLLPVDVQKAAQYIPVPEFLTDSRGEREIRVFLARQYFGAYEKGKLLFWGPVSSGRKTYATPPGKFFVNYKQRHKRSIKYDNAPMPYSINYYGGYFMHQQSLPGYPASHGCVRLLMTDAEKLFNWVRVRDAVTVVRDGV